MNNDGGVVCILNNRVLLMSGSAVMGVNSRGLSTQPCGAPVLSPISRHGVFYSSPECLVFHWASWIRSCWLLSWSQQRAVLLQVPEDWVKGSRYGILWESVGFVLSMFIIFLPWCILWQLTVATVKSSVLIWCLGIFQMASYCASVSS